MQQQLRNLFFKLVLHLMGQQFLQLCLSEFCNRQFGTLFKLMPLDLFLGLVCYSILYSLSLFDIIMYFSVERKKTYISLSY